MVGNEDNWQAAKNEGLWAASSKKTMKDVAKGDKIVAYVSGWCAFKGVFRATSGFYQDKTPIFGYERGIYPYRVKITPEILLENPVSIRPLINKLSFIKDAEIWGAYFQQSVRKISREDFEKILSHIKSEASI